MAYGLQQPAVELVGALCMLTQLGARITLCQSSLQPGESLRPLVEQASQRARKPPAHQLERARPLRTIGCDELGSAGRCRCAHVRHEIGNREIDFMADAAHE